MSELILTKIHPQTRTILPDLKKVGSYLRVFTVSYFTKQPLL